MIRKINKGNKQYGIGRLKLIGLTIEDVHEDDIQLVEEGALLILEKELKKGTTYSITLPHHLTVKRNAILVSISPEVAEKCNSISAPTLLRNGFDGYITVNLRPREDFTLPDDFVLLSVVDVAV